MTGPSVSGGRAEQRAVLFRMIGTEKQFPRDILVEALLNQQCDELVNRLSLLQVLELPLPKDAISAVCGNIIDLEKHCGRAVVLGLLEERQFGE